jgi:hypothetical protein
MPLPSAVAGLAGALTLAAGSPFEASTAPVSVISCDYDVQNVAALTNPETPAARAGALRISFVNQAPQTATSVRFMVRYADGTQVIDDAGTFSTGTPVTQTFAPNTTSPYGGSAECAVASVTFADGSTWQPG